MQNIHILCVSLLWQAEEEAEECKLEAAVADELGVLADVASPSSYSSNMANADLDARYAILFNRLQQRVEEAELLQNRLSHAVRAVQYLSNSSSHCAQMSLDQVGHLKRKVLL